MTRYYQRPIVEAIQWESDNYRDVLDLIADRHEGLSYDGPRQTIELWSGGRRWVARVGDWITRQPEGVRVWTDAAFREQHEPL